LQYILVHVFGRPSSAPSYKAERGKDETQISKTTLIDLQRIDVILTTSNNESRYLIFN
jgi:hypothetical protein